jgi:hypothetical protein
LDGLKDHAAPIPLFPIYGPVARFLIAQNIGEVAGADLPN